MTRGMTQNVLQWHYDVHTWIFWQNCTSHLLVNWLWWLVTLYKMESDFEFFLVIAFSCECLRFECSTLNAVTTDYSLRGGLRMTLPAWHTLVLCSNCSLNATLPTSNKALWPISWPSAFPFSGIAVDSKVSNLGSIWHFSGCVSISLILLLYLISAQILNSIFTSFILIETRTVVFSYVQ